MSSFAVNSAVGSSLHLSEQSGCEDAEHQVVCLFLSLHLRLRRYALNFGVSAADAEDIVQESFLALFQHLRLGRSRENLHGWLFRVTHNLALKKRIRSSREVIGPDYEQIAAADPDTGPLESMLLRERHARMQSVLSALPLNDQLCLRLRAEGLTYRGIAKVVGISLGSVSASLTRSLLRLQVMDGRK